MKRSILIMLLVLSIGVYAQNNTKEKSKTTKDTLKLNEVVVTGTPVKVNKNDVPMSVTVITREQIDESDEISLLPILNGRVPGLFVTERGVTGFGVGQTGAGQITM